MFDWKIYPLVACAICALLFAWSVPATPSSKPQLVAPRTFNDAQEVAEFLRERETGGRALLTFRRA